MLVVGFWAKDSLECSAFRPFWRAPTNIYWFGWENFIISSLNRVIYSLRDSEGPWRMLNRLVVNTFLCLLVEKYYTIFLVRSWYPVMDNFGKLMYQRKATSLNVPAMSLHFKESEVMTIAIWLLIEHICSRGSLFPSKDVKGGGLKFSGTWSPQIASERGWGSRSFSFVSSSLVLCLSVWTLSYKDSFC